VAPDPCNGVVLDDEASLFRGSGGTTTGLVSGGDVVVEEKLLDEGIGGGAVGEKFLISGKNSPKNAIMAFFAVPVTSLFGALSFAINNSFRASKFVANCGGATVVLNNFSCIVMLCFIWVL